MGRPITVVLVTLALFDTADAEPLAFTSYFNYLCETNRSESSCLLRGPNEVPISSVVTSPSRTTVDLDGTYIFNPGDITTETEATYSVDTILDFGILRTRADLTASGHVASQTVGVVSVNLVADVLNFSTGSAFTFDFTLQGSALNSTVPPTFNGAVGDSYVRLTLGQYGTPNLFDTRWLLISNQGIDQRFTSPLIPVSAGGTQVYAALAVYSFVGCSNLNAPFLGCDAWSGVSRTDFLDTAIMTGIDVFDATGHPVDNFTVTSASGAHYTASGVTTPQQVPEPSTLGLFVLAIGITRLRSHLSRRRGH